jgi:hypothetical protein
MCNAKEPISTLTHLLSGELTAVATCRQAPEMMNREPIVLDLRRIVEQHMRQ